MPRTGRPREFDEDAVVATATDLFWEQGYEATSVQDLVERVGLQRGSLYSAFGDKRGLFTRALDHYVDRTVAALGTLADGPVLPQLRAALLAALQPPAGRAGRGCLLGNTAVELSAADPAVRESVRAGFARTEAAFRRAVERAQDTGELPPGDAAARAALLLVLLQGLQVVARTEPDPGRLADAVDAALAGLGRPGSG